MKTIDEAFEKYIKKGLFLRKFEYSDMDKTYAKIDFEGGYTICLMEVSEELRNIIEYKDDGRDIEERLIDFCKKIFEETHDE